MTDRFVHAIYRMAEAVLCLLPLRLVHGLGETIGRFAWWIAIPYRRIAMRNLEIAYGREMSPGELRALGKTHFRTLCGNFLASAKVASLSREQIRAAVTIEGIDGAEHLFDGERGSVFVISHLGNWELIAQIFPLLTGRPLGTVYQRLSNPYMDQSLREKRSRLGLQTFERKQGIQAAMKMLREGGGVGVLIDQHAGDAGVWCPFFGRLASTTSLPATMALRTGAALMPFAVYTEGLGKWRFVFSPEVKAETRDVDGITAQLNQVLERQIRRSPKDWFWVHSRWKTPKPKFLLAEYKRGVVRGPNGGELQPFRIVIRSPNWLGDAVMCIPAVRAIRAGRPDAHVTVLTPAKLGDLWREVCEVDAVLEIASTASVWAVSRRIKAGDFEAAILFPNSLRSALEVWLAGVPRRVGRPGHRRRWLLNQVFQKKPKRKKDAAPPPQHHAHEYLDIARFVGALVDDAAVGFPLGERARGRGLTIGLCPGAEYGPAKRWFPERFAEVVRTLSAERPDCTWKVFGVGKDAEVAGEICEKSGVSMENLVGKTTLGELIAELRKCDVLLSNDTGTMHLAAFLGVPVVAVFGSTEPRLTGPFGTGHQIVRHHVECSPCFLRECPIDFRCMKAIEVPEVVAALQRLISVPMTEPEQPVCN